MRPSFSLLVAAIVLMAAVTGLGQEGMPFADGSARLTGDEAAVTLTSRFDRGHPPVATYIEGKGPYSFVLDTGASFSVMLPALAKSLRLKERKVKGTKFTYVEVPLKCPGVEVDRHRFYTFVEQLPGAGIAGLLGHDFLRQFVVEVDYSRPVVRLHDPKKFRPPAEDDPAWVSLPLKLEKNAPVVPIRLNFFRDGSEEFTALIDTGGNFNPMYTDEAVRKIGGRMIESAQLGQLAISSFVCCDPVPVHQLSQPPFPYQMILTGSVLARVGAHLIIDYPGGKVYVRSAR